MGEMTAEARSADILLVDDDASLLEVLGLALEEAGFTVRTARDGREGWRSFTARVPDLVVLDLLMPELDGLGLCRLIREQRHCTPIIMLTSRDEEMDKIIGLEMGADDYVTKPFSTRELIARARAALRRVRMAASSPVAGGGQPEDDRRQVGALRLDRGRHEARVGTEAVRLTAIEFDLLWTLVERPGHVYTRRLLIDRVYGETIVVSDRTIDTFIKRLRHKLAGARPGFAPIETVRGVGYRCREDSSE